MGKGGKNLGAKGQEMRIDGSRLQYVNHTSFVVSASLL